MKKSEIRKNILHRRLELRQEELRFSQNKLSYQIHQNENFIHSKNVGIYYPIKNEVDPTVLLKEKTNK